MTAIDWKHKEEQVKALRERYPKGTRVKLLNMDDFQAPPTGTLGTIQGVDDFGNILMHWDTGSTLNIIYGEDQFEVVKDN